MRRPTLAYPDLLRWTLDILRSYSIRPKDWLSQSFVVDPRLIREVVGIVRGINCVCIYEIGSGLGTLTYFLAQIRKRIIAIEIDYGLVRVSRDILDDIPYITIVHGDALEIPWQCDCVVSNAPYGITSNLLVKIARSNNVRWAVLLLQREVVSRILARPGSSDYGRLTILLNTLFNVKGGRVFPPESFYPRPKVYSQIIVLERREKYTRIHSVLEEVTRIIFSERRKRALTVISKRIGLDESLLRGLGISDEMRVYDLCPEILLEISRIVAGRRST